MEKKATWNSSEQLRIIVSSLSSIEELVDVVDSTGNKKEKGYIICRFFAHNLQIRGNKAVEYAINYEKKEIEDERKSQEMKNQKPSVPAYAQFWEESERGWGVRPDGVTICKSKEIARKCVEDLCKSYTSPSAPDFYTRESGMPRLIVIPKWLSEEIEKENGKRFFTDSEFHKMIKNNQIIAD
jgi:hypothetical protein